MANVGLRIRQKSKPSTSIDGGGGYTKSRSKTKTLNLLKNEVIGIGFILPSLIPLLVFTIYPIFRSFYLSFFSYNMVTQMKFVGWRNYKRLFQAPEIWKTIGVNLSYVLVILPVVIIGGFILSVLLSKKTRSNVIYRTIYFAPHVTSMVAMSSVWLFIFHPQYGIANRMLEAFSLPPVRWLNQASTAFWCVCIVSIWRMIGYDTLVFIGGVQNISDDVMEAATIDGASAFTKVTKIIFPLVSPTSFMLLILNTITIMKMYTVINVLTGGGPAGSTQNLVVMLENYAFKRFQVGYASAISNVLFFLILVIHVFQRFLERKVQYDQ